MRIWNTKYCLTNGITQHDVLDVPESQIISTPRTEKYYPMYLNGEGKEWHKSLASAISRAEEMRDKKIKYLYKKIAKIEKINFECIT